MKKISYLLGLVFLSSLMVFTSCEKDEETPVDTSSALPSAFSIDIPEAISADATTSSRSTNSDVLDGGEIYHHLRGFIHVGEVSGQIVEGIISAISTHQINRAMDITYTSDEDNREKSLVVVENVTFESTSYEFKMTISDVLTNGKGLQIFWNRNPIAGVAILKPHNINTTDNDQPNAIYRIDYSEAVYMNYEKHMEVSIANRDIEDGDIYGLDNLKMFVGETGDIIEVYGNSNHPNAVFFDDGIAGYDWAFVAASDRSLNIGVAEVGLPSNTLASNDRATLLEDNSIYNVFNNKINAIGTYSQTDINAFLANTIKPGYFNNGGFVQAEFAPTDNNYSIIEEKITNLRPYNPLDISNLTIAFE